MPNNLQYEIELAGATVGPVWSVEGGGAYSEVVVEKFGPDQIRHKHLAGVAFDDIRISTGPGLQPGFWEWLEAIQSSAQKDGAILVTDPVAGTQTRRDWFQAFVRRIDFPALDVDVPAKTPAMLGVALAPSFTQRRTATPPTPARGSPKAFSSSQFRVTMAGLDSSKFLRVSGISLTAKNVDDQPTRHVDVSNLTLTVTEASAEALFKWHENFVIKGNNEQLHEKFGAIEYLDEDGALALRLELHGIGVFRLDPGPPMADGTRTVAAQAYVERASFQHGSVETAPPARRLGLNRFARGID